MAAEKELRSLCVSLFGNILSGALYREEWFAPRTNDLPVKPVCRICCGLWVECRDFKNPILPMGSARNKTERVKQNVQG